MATVPSTQKILTSNEAVNTTYGGSQALKELNTWYTMEDISNTVKPYEVFTALLTQSGGDNAVGVSGEEGIINIGVTYLINENPNNDDLTIYGALNNEVGTYFIANQTGILNYTDSLMLLYDTGAPVATVLENTIGNVWFTYADIGSYNFNSNGLFIENKTIYFVTPSYSDDYNIIGIGYGNTNVVQITTINVSNLTQSANSLLSNTPIEIRVYN